MNYGENLRLVLRWIGKRPVESFLLITGIALGIGATSAGFALFLNTQNENLRLIQSTNYREIVVSTRENVEEMELPAVPVIGEEITILLPLTWI